MMTRRAVAHTYNSSGHPATHPRRMYPALAYGPGGGMDGGAVLLNTGGWVGIRHGGTGYGYLGLDPSDPATWVVRRFNPATGMISYLNEVAR